MEFCTENSIDELKRYATMLIAFIHEHKSLINLYVLDYFVENHWKSIPLSWQNILSTLEPKDLSVFLDSSGRIISYEVWPLSLLAFRATAFALALPRKAMTSMYPVKKFLEGVSGKECTDFVSKPWGCCNLNSLPLQNKSLPEVCRKHVKPKKQHEIHRLSEVTNLVLKNINIDRIIDIGSGLGHLSRVLSLQYNWKVATVEALSSHVSGASTFDKQALRSLRSKSSSHLTSTDSVSKCQETGALGELPQHVKAYITPTSLNVDGEEILQRIWATNQTSVEEMQALLE